MNFSRQPELSFSMEERASLCEVLDKQLVIALSTTVHRLNLTQNEFESSSETESASKYFLLSVWLSINRFLK